MKVSKIAVILQILLAFILVHSCNKNTQSEPIKPAPSSALAAGPGLTEQNTQVPVKPENSQYQVADINPEVAKAIDVRKLYLLPIFERIWSYSVKCDGLIDDPKALEEFNRAGKSEKPASKIADEKMNADMHSCKNLAEIETKFRENSQETIVALAQIQEKYPCSEAGAMALLSMITKLWRPDYLYYCAGWVMEDEKIRIENYIISNYPNTWEAEKAKFWRDNRGKSSLESIDLMKNLIRYQEENDLQNNKYFLIWTQKLEGPNYNSTVSLYETVASRYFSLGILSGNDSIKKTGRLSAEGIKYCQEGLNTYEELKRKYPNAKKYPASGIPHMGQRCYDMIHHVGEYKDK